MNLKFIAHRVVFLLKLKTDSSVMLSTIIFDLHECHIIQTDCFCLLLITDTHSICLY